MTFSSSQALAPQTSRRALLAASAGLGAIALAGPSLAQPSAPGSKSRGAAALPAAQPLSLTLNANERAQLWKALAEADQHGFEPGEFAPAELGDQLTGTDADALGKAQATLVAGVLRYARAQHGLRGFHGEDWPKDWALKPSPYDAEKDLAFAVSQNKVSEWLNGLPPPFARYRALKAALAELRAAPPPQAAKSTKHASKTGLASAKSGVRSKAKLASAATIADRAAKASGAATLTHGEQERALIANMERWRWMPRNIAADRIEANTAAGLLQVFQNNQPTLAMKCAAGKEGDETPILTSAIDSIVFNPAWHIPKSIAADEIIPKNKRHPGYFKSEGIIYSKESESGLLQKPGPKNALGQIKFDFKNPFSVYLHDTPAQSAFARTSRNVSHGCVRVEKPIDLAALLLQGTDAGSPEAIQQLISGGGASGSQAGDPAASSSTEPDKASALQGRGRDRKPGSGEGADQASELKTRRVQTPKPMPVFLLYWTAFPGEGGKVEFRKDVYGWDTRLLAMLSAGRETAKA